MSSGAILLPRRSSTPLDEERRRGAIQSLASRALLVLSILTVIASLRPTMRWIAIDLFPEVTARTARSGLLLLAIALAILARGLRRGHRTAWLLSTVALALGVILHIMHGTELLVSLLTAAGAVWLGLQHRAFPVRLTRPFLRRLAAGLVAVGVLVAGLGLIVFVRNASWHHVLREVDVVLLIVFLIAMAWSLFSPVRTPHLSAFEHRARREQARAVVERHGTGSLDWFALRDDKDWFFSGSSVVAYSARGGVCMVSPDPIGPPDEREAVWAEMTAYARDLGTSLCVVGASQDWLPLYESTGLRTVYLGDEAVVDCAAFTLEGHSHKALRQAVNRVARGGWTTRLVDPLSLPEDDRRAIEEMVGQSRRGDTERGFSMTLSRLFDPDDRGLLMSVTRSPEGRVDAVCQWVPARALDGWSLDLMRRRLRDQDGQALDLPNGLIDATIVATIEEIAARGRRGESGGHALTLNFAVMRDLLEPAADRPGSALDAAIRPLLKSLSRTTQMGSLSRFNEKFDPWWMPRYVVLDAPEYVAGQALALADAEGLTELPVIGRLLGRAGGAR